MHSGTIIKEQRLKHKMSQKTLSLRTGYDQSTISNIERGRNDPSPDLRKKIAIIFGISEAALVVSSEELNNLKEVKTEVVLRIPVVSWGKAGGEGIDIQPVTDFEGKNIEFKNCRAIEIIGDSLAPIAYNGNRIIYSQSKIINEGDLVYLGLKDGNKYVKRYYNDKRNNIIILQPINVANHHGPRNVREKDIEFVHKVVGVSFDQ